MLVALRSGGRAADDVRAHVADGGGEVTVSGSVFRQENGVLLVVRMSRVQSNTQWHPSASSTNAVLLKLVQSAPDCVVVTDVNGQIISANDAFVELVQLANEEQVRGESLGRWVGRTGVELSVLISTLRQRASLRLVPHQPALRAWLDDRRRNFGHAGARQRRGLPRLHDSRCQPAARHRPARHKGACRVPRGSCPSWWGACP